MEFGLGELAQETDSVARHGDSLSGEAGNQMICPRGGRFAGARGGMRKENRETPPKPTAQRADLV